LVKICILFIQDQFLDKEMVKEALHLGHKIIVHIIGEVLLLDVIDHLIEVHLDGIDHLIEVLLDVIDHLIEVLQDVIDHLLEDLNVIIEEIEVHHVEEIEALLGGENK